MLPKIDKYQLVISVPTKRMMLLSRPREEYTVCGLELDFEYKSNRSNDDSVKESCSRCVAMLRWARSCDAKFEGVKSHRASMEFTLNFPDARRLMLFAENLEQNVSRVLGSLENLPKIEKYQLVVSCRTRYAMSLTRPHDDYSVCRAELEFENKAMMSMNPDMQKSYKLCAATMKWAGSCDAMFESMKNENGIVNFTLGFYDAERLNMFAESMEINLAGALGI